MWMGEHWSDLCTSTDNRSSLQPTCLFIQQSCTLNGVQYLADRDVLQVAGFHKMTTEALVHVKNTVLYCPSLYAMECTHVLGYLYLSGALFFTIISHFFKYSPFFFLKGLKKSDDKCGKIMVEGSIKLSKTCENAHK